MVVLATHQLEYRCGRHRSRGSAWNYLDRVVFKTMHWCRDIPPQGPLMLPANGNPASFIKALHRNLGYYTWVTHYQQENCYRARYTRGLGIHEDIRGPPHPQNGSLSASVKNLFCPQDNWRSLIVRWTLVSVDISANIVCAIDQTVSRSQGKTIFDLPPFGRRCTTEASIHNVKDTYGPHEWSTSSGNTKESIWLLVVSKNGRLGPGLRTVNLRQSANARRWQLVQEPLAPLYKQAEIAESGDPWCRKLEGSRRLIRKVRRLWYILAPLSGWER
jgi:hypothetical protein